MAAAGLGLVPPLLRLHEDLEIRPLLKDPPPAAGFGALASPSQPTHPPTHPHQKSFPQAKKEIYWKFEADFSYTQKILAFDPPAPHPPQGVGSPEAIACWNTLGSEVAEAADGALGRERARHTAVVHHITPDSRPPPLSLG